MARTVTYELLRSSDAAHIKDLLSKGYSVLDSLGAHSMRVQMAVVGRICQALVWLIFLSVRRPTCSLLKRRAASVIKFFFPTTIRINHMRIGGNHPAGIVIYFNHQSLFEVLAVLWYCMVHFPGKRMYFPMNLPWYEGLTPIIGKLEQLGIHVTPLITPSTQRKLQKATRNRPESADLIAHLKSVFDAEYSRPIIPFLEHGDIIAVAPSATRTTYIFPSRAAYTGEDTSELPGTMTKIVFHLRRVGFDVYFVPFVATRDKPAGRGLNIWRRHDVCIGPARTLADMSADLRAGTLDHSCFMRLAQFVPARLHYPHC